MPQAAEPLTSAAAPTRESERIVSLDVIRGVALLGILLLNIVGMGMLSTAYFHPFGSVAGAEVTTMDLAAWGINELFFEGALRGLFSVLFGAGVVLFTQSKSATLHYRRTFWLFMFGVFDALVLLWTGDILLVYALAGALLYWARNAPARRLLACAAAVFALLFVARVVMVVSLELAQSAHDEMLSADVVTTDSPADVAAEAELSQAWVSFKGDVLFTEERRDEELAARRASYASAFAWTLPAVLETLAFVVPTFMLWDALLMMLVGMALFKQGVLQGDGERRYYQRLAVWGIGLGVVINAVEVYRSVVSEFNALTAYSFLQPTYDLGRVCLAVGYMALIVLWVRSGKARGLALRLAAVGRMALTNYLMHSLIALFVFTGAGLGLVGQLDRIELYLVVLAIWLLQLVISPWWLARYKQGPIEALWRRLTYGRAAG